MGVAEKIKEMRIKSGMSQQTFADALYVSGNLVSKWECGTRRPDYRMIERIAEIFGVQADDILDKNDVIFRELNECIQDENLGEEEFTDILNGFLRTQTEKYAGVFIKRYYFQKSIAEISAEYGIGENHARSILSKIRKKLKKYVREKKND